MQIPIALIVLVPALAAFGAARVPSRWAGRVAVVASGIAFALAAIASLDGQRGVHLFGTWVSGLGIDISFRADALTLSLALLVSGVGTLILYYSGVYFGPDERGRRALSWLLAFEASMLGLVLADDALLLFVFWELTGVCSFFLIQLDADRSPEAEPAARQALLVTVLGGLPLLVGLIFLQQQLGTSSLTAWSMATLDPRSANVAFVLVGLGAVAKSAQFPFHFWLPGAMAAPSPVSAYLHSATMVKAGVILLLFLFPLLHTATLWTPLLLGMGAITSVWGSYRALTESDVKKIMAWSTVSQLGLLVLTLGLGTELAARAALLHLFAHGVFKAGLFLTVGSIDKAAGTRELGRLGGLARREPWLAAVAVICAGSMAGLPPLAGFLSKELILKKTMLADPAVHIPALLAIVIASIGTMAYSIRFVAGVFWGSAASAGSDSAAAKGKSYKPLAFGLVAAPVVLAILTFAAGSGASLTDRFFLEPSIQALLGHDLDPPKLKLWYGWNLPLFLSLGILGLGTLLHRILRGRLLPLADPGLAPHRLYHGALETAAKLGTSIDRLLTAGDPRFYVVLPLLVGFIPAWIMVSPSRAWEVEFEGVALLVATGLAASAVALAHAQGHVTKIVWSSILGFGVAVLFRTVHAPDLVLTQLLVEMIVTVVLLLGIRRLFDRKNKAISTNTGMTTRSPLPQRLMVHAVSLFVAGGAASLVFAFSQGHHSAELREFYTRAGPALAKGHNLVNVILVDFRGLDTFIESWVVLLAGLGVVALFRGAELGNIRVPESTLQDSGLLLRTASRFLVPFTGLLALGLFLQGHDDPGGGFVASLVLVLGWLLFALSRGDRSLQRHGNDARRWALAGSAVLLLSALIPLALGMPALRQAGTTLFVNSPFAWKTHSSLFFDLGVVMTVAGIGIGAVVALLVGGRK